MMETLDIWMPVIERAVGKMLLTVAGLFVLWRAVYATYQVAGLTVFILTSKCKHPKHTNATAVIFLPVMWFVFATKGKIKDGKVWTKRSDGKKVQAFTWHGGFNWTINDPNECSTRVERMASHCSYIPSD